jgi:putative oxidoreductase
VGFRCPPAGYPPNMSIGRLLTRTLVGGLFIGHGTQKLFGWFGGHGPEGTGQFFQSARIRPGRRNALAAGAAETAGGALLALGFLTPLAGAALSGVMITAVRHVHFQKGLWSSNGGYEYNAVLLAAIFGLVESGPGQASVDAMLGRERAGARWALAQLAAGAAASAVVSELARLEAEREKPPERVTYPLEPEEAEVRKPAGSKATV